MSDAGRAPNTTDFNPEFASRLQAFRDALTKAGIQTQIASGYRSPEYQNQMYQNHLAQAAKKPLPYPNVEAPKVVAPAWQSFHNYGIAADVTPANPADYPRMWDMANRFGLTALRQKDMDHFQLSGSLASNIAQYKLAGWRPDSSPAPTTEAIAYAGPGVPQPVGTTINAASVPVAGGLAKPAGGGFLTSVANIESNDSNVPSRSDKDYPGQPGSKSQGHWQIDTPTWLQFAAKAGIDTTKFPNAMSAPRDVQEQVASLIPLSRFGGRTVRMLNDQYKTTLDKSLTLGELDTKYGGGGGGGASGATAPGVVDPSAVARGSTVNPAVPGDGTAAPAPAGATAVASAAPPTDDRPWYAKAFGALVQGQDGKPSPFDKFSEALAGGNQAAKEAAAAQAPEKSALTSSGPGARNVSPGLQNVAQTYGQTLNSFSQPLTWNSAPPQAPNLPAAGLQPTPGYQPPGVTLNSVQPSPYGVGYGINPVGYGFG